MVVNSFAELSKIWNSTHGREEQVKMKKSSKEEKSRKCRVCGSDMERIANSNVYVCHGTVEKSKPTESNPDAKEKVPCKNFFISKQERD